MIAYKLCYVATDRIHGIQRLTVKRDCRSYRTYTVKTLGLTGRKNPVQTILVLLVESGLVYLGVQVSHFYKSLPEKCAYDPQGYYRSDR